MARLLSFLLVILIQVSATGQQKTIHAYVALCDNLNQGIVPVSASLGNGQNPTTNLYWGAAYGVKSYFRDKTDSWDLVSTKPSSDSLILERLLFKHQTEEIYMLADAFDGAYIKACIEQFLGSANGQNQVHIRNEGQVLNFGGGSDLVAFLGHNGLMDFSVDITYEPVTQKPKDVIILACYSKQYFSPEIKSAKANPLLWTTHLMAPEAYTFKAALDSWITGALPEEVEESAAQLYNRYQKCGINGARNLFTTGY